MGTRSLTHIKDHGDTILTIYRQYDGYLTAHGQELANILNGGKLTNGFGGEPEIGEKFNGMGDLAAQLIHLIKDSVGNIYVYTPDSADCGEEYVYTIYDKDGVLHIRAEYGNESLGVIFDGPSSEFDGKKLEEEEIKLLTS